MAQSSDSHSLTDERIRRRILWSLPSPLFLLGTRADIDGKVQRNLMTASFLTQIATKPAVIVVSVETEAVTQKLLSVSELFSISLLKKSDRELVRHFAKPVGEDECDFDGDHLKSMRNLPVLERGSEPPVVENAHAWMICKAVGTQSFESHMSYFGEVTSWGSNDIDSSEGILVMDDTRMHYGG